MLSQHENGFLTLRVSLAGRRKANLLDDEAALLKHTEGRSVARGGSGDQRTLRDFPQQLVEQTVRELGGLDDQRNDGKPRRRQDNEWKQQ